MADTLDIATYEQIAIILSQLMTNYNALADNYYNIFYSTTPADITIKLYDTNGVLKEYTLPNRAKDFNYIKNGEGTPEGNVSGIIGTIYQDTLNGVVYIKQVGTGKTGWVEIPVNKDIEEGYISPEGNLTRPKGTLYVDKSTASLYIKSTTSGNTGWTLISVTSENNAANQDLSNLSSLGENRFANPSLDNLNSEGERHFANLSLSNLNPYGEARFSEKASVDLDNLSNAGEAKLASVTGDCANIDLSNLSNTGEAVINGRASVDLDNISSAGEAVITSLASGANTSLSNLLSDGNAKFQNAPFSINAGAIDANGDNETLTYSSAVLTCASCTITTADGRTKTFTTDNTVDCSNEADGTYKVMKSYIDGNLSLFAQNYYVQKTIPVTGIPFAQPVMTSNGTMGGDSFAVSDYSAFDNNSSTNVQLGTTTTVTDLIWYNPEPLNISEITITNRAGTNINALTNFSIYGSDDGTTWTKVGDYTNAVTGANASWSINITDFNYKYGKLYFNGYAAMIQELDITATSGSAQTSGDLWLDNSKYPLALKEYDGADWQVNNDLVYIGDVTVASGVITAIKNRYFNACPAYRILVDNYQNGSSYYAVYSDGWCEQGGITICTSSTNSQGVSLLKTMQGTNYIAIVHYNPNSAITEGGSSTGQSVNRYNGSVCAKTTSSFTIQATDTNGGAFSWLVCGYIN